MAAIAQTAPVWTPLIKAQHDAIVEALKDHNVEVLEDFSKELYSALEQQVDEHSTLFKKSATIKAKAPVDEKCICCAFTIKDGAPVRCTRKRKTDEHDYCLTHSTQCALFGGKPKYGRYDEEVPLTYTRTDKDTGCVVEEKVPI